MSVNLATDIRCPRVPPPQRCPTRHGEGGVPLRRCQMRRGVAYGHVSLATVACRQAAP